MKVVLGGVVLLLQEQIKKNGGEIIMKNIEGGFGKKEADFFETAKRYLLNDSKELLDLLKSYDKDSIPQKFIQQLEQ